MHYDVYKEYEAVFLKVKALNKIITVGDFCGDVEKAIISPEERYCVMVGFGIIVYFLREPSLIEVKEERKYEKRKQSINMDR